MPFAYYTECNTTLGMQITPKNVSGIFGYLL